MKNDSIERFHQDPLKQLLVVKSIDSTSTGLDPSVRKCILPGSFNPLHSGHIEMAERAQTQLNRPVWYELSIKNADKKDLSTTETIDRAKQDFRDCGLVVTRAPTFAEKLQIFPNSTFVVGADTIIRIDDVRFYENENHKQSVLQLFAEHSARFLVFGRSFQSRFWSSDVAISHQLKSLCDFVPRTEFDNPISSTRLRNN